MYVKVHVYPGMKKEKVISVAEHVYEFVLKEPAARNAANNRTKALVAELYKVNLSAVRIVTGHRSPSKMLEVL